MDIAHVLEQFPDDLRNPVRGLCDWIREERAVTREDFGELKAIVTDLAEAQQRTEERVEELAEAQRDLTAAQQRTESRVEELAEAQKDLTAAQQRTESRVEELAEAQKDLTAAQQRTEERVEELTAAQQRTESRVEELAATMQQGFKGLRDSIATLGSRWGIMAEETFRATIAGLLEKGGYTVSRGLYGGREVDLVIRNGDHILLEVTSALKAADVPKIIASVDDYEARTGVTPQAMVAAIFIPPLAMRALADAPRRIDLFSIEDES